MRYRYLSDTVDSIVTFFFGLLFIGLWLVAAAAWITHVLVCIKASACILLLFGCIVAPVGVIHGVGVWVGVF